jgi:choline transport protein
MYALEHPNFEVHRWHVFVTYLVSLSNESGEPALSVAVNHELFQLVTWIGCLSVCFFNKAMPYLNTAGIFLILAGLLVTVITV